MLNSLRKLAQKFAKYLFKKFLRGHIVPLVKEVIMHENLVFNSYGKLQIGESSVVLNALFNLSSGNIIIGKKVSFGHNVSCLTGSHDVTKFDVNRQEYAKFGNDIVIEDGVWIGSNVTILGPCVIGKNAAIAAFSLVNKDVPPYALFGGVPAKKIKSLNH